MSKAVAQSDLIPPERLAEASVWIARLHSDERDPELEAGFRQWLVASESNAKAFELATEVWEDAANLRRVVPLLGPPQRGVRHYLTLGAVTVAALIVVAIAIAWLLPSGVTTAVGEQRMLTLTDGTRVYLNTATHVVVRYDRAVRRVELTNGEALFAVAKRPDWPFIVTAGDRQVRALGTSFVVRRDLRKLAVTLVEGKVTVSPGEGSAAVGPGRRGMNSNQSYTLTPGQRLTIPADGPARLDTPSIDKAIAWRRGQIILDDTPLAAAAAEMNRYSPTQLIIERPETAELLVSGLFQAGDTASFAHAVAETHGLRILERTDRIVLLGLPTRHASGQPVSDSSPL